MGQNRVYRGEELSAVSMKSTVKGYWEEEPCTTRGVDESDRKAFFDQIERQRYALEPRIPLFALFPRPLVRALGPRFGFARNIEAVK